MDSDLVSGLVSDVVTPYQARALTTPTRPATGMAQPAGTRLISNAAADRTRNSASSQAAARSGGSVRHHQLAALPWLSSRPYSISTGSTPRNGHENGSNATPNVSATSGDSRSTAQMVSTMLDPSSRVARGRASSRGQASQASTASSTLRAATIASRVSMNRGQVPPSPNSQRRSWNTASGASAVTSGDRARAAGAVTSTAAASAIGTATATAISAGRPRKPRGKPAAEQVKAPAAGTSARAGARPNPDISGGPVTVPAASAPVRHREEWTSSAT